MPLPTHPQRKLLSTAVVAEQLDMSERHVRRMIAAGELRAVQFGRVYRVPDESLDELIARKTVRVESGAQRATSLAIEPEASHV